MSNYIVIPKPTFPAEEVVGPNNPLPVTGNMTMTGGAVVTVGNFPSSYPVTGPLTDSQLRATAFDVKLTDSYGFDAEFTPNDEMRVVTPFRIVGSTFVGTTIDTNFWTPSAASGATVAPTQADGEITVSTLTTANGTCNVQSVRTGRYIGGSSNRFRGIITTVGAANANNVRRWGAFSTAGGAFFELNGTTLNVCTAKTNLTSSATNIGDAGVYRVASGAWNEDTTAPTLTNVNTYEIYYNNSKVYFVIGGVLKHTMATTTQTWTDNIQLPCRLESTNSNGSTTPYVVKARNMVIHRLGSAMSLPTWKYQSGTTAGVICKIGQGNLNRVIIGSAVDKVVITLYDGITTGGNVIASWTLTAGAGANDYPFSLDMGNLPFFTGLFLVTTKNANVTLVYE